MLFSSKVGSLPRSSDLERQRERTMAEAENLSTLLTWIPPLDNTSLKVPLGLGALEVQSISSSLSDRHRESAERLQKELADVTATP